MADIYVNGVRLTPEQVAELLVHVEGWRPWPVEEWGLPALVCKAVADALPVSDE